MAGIELTPSRPPRAFSVKTRAEMLEAYTVLIDDYGCQGSVSRGQALGGGSKEMISVNRDGQGPPAEAELGSDVMIVADVSGVWALTADEIEQRYGHG